jgi:hypothetical protein
MRSARWFVVIVLLLLLAAAGFVAFRGRMPDTVGNTGLAVWPTGAEAGEVANAQADAPTGGVPDELTPTPSPTPGAAQLTAALKDGNYGIRLAAAAALPSRADIPVASRADMLGGALTAEIAKPETAPPPDGAYLPATDTLRLQFTRLMGKLGPAAQASLRQQATANSGEAHERALLALGYAGDGSVVGDVRKMLLEAQNPTVRMDAAHLLGELHDPAAIPELKRALTDPYKVDTKRSSGESEVFYPVRDQAAGSLYLLGVNVDLQADGSYKLGKP